VTNCRGIGKKDHINNDKMPKIIVDAEQYEVRVDGVHISCKPSDTLPLAQRYFLF
jgi:urease alpha subunit